MRLQRRLISRDEIRNCNEEVNFKCDGFRLKFAVQHADKGAQAACVVRPGPITGVNKSDVRASSGACATWCVML